MTQQSGIFIDWMLEWAERNAKLMMQERSDEYTAARQSAEAAREHGYLEAERKASIEDL